MRTSTMRDSSVRPLIEETVRKQRLGRYNDAAALCRRLVRSLQENGGRKAGLQGSTVAALVELGAGFERNHRMGEAIACYQQALLHRPTAPLYNRLACVFKGVGDAKAAIDCFRQALKLSPHDGAILNNLGNALKEKNRFDEAIECYQESLRSNVSDPLAVHINLARAFYNENRVDEGLEVLERALAIDPKNHYAKFARLIGQLPTIYASVDEIRDRRDRYRRCLEDFSSEYAVADSATRAEAADAVGSMQPFYLAYQGLNDRALQATYGQMICRLMAARFPQWSRRLAMPTPDVSAKLRVGFVSGYFRRHSVWKIPLKGWVQYLDRNKFELFGYHTSPLRDEETDVAAASFSKFIQGPLSTEDWAEVISRDRLHVLIYPELGMDPMALRLACLRLAPVQVNSLGHPDSSGLPTVDYYLSSDLMEPENAQDHYTEKIVRLPNLSVYYEPLEFGLKVVNTREIGVGDDDTMFWCCQSLFKYLPQHDDIFPRIAREVGDCKFVFIKNPRSERITEVFRRRLDDAFRAQGLDSSNHCIFLDPMDAGTFAATAASADAFLDNIGWCGFNSAMESLVHNIPIVTFADELMRGRHASAPLRMMGLDELIAPTKEDYVRIATRLGTDPEYCWGVSERIAENKHKLFRDMAPIGALEEFLFTAVDEYRMDSNDGR